MEGASLSPPVFPPSFCSMSFNDKRERLVASPICHTQGGETSKILETACRIQTNGYDAQRQLISYL